MSKLRRGQVFITNGNSVTYIAPKRRARKGKDLFVTLCGKVVSTEEESKNTSCVGYRIIKSYQASCQRGITQDRIEKIAESQYSQYHREGG